MLEQIINIFFFCFFCGKLIITTTNYTWGCGLMTTLDRLKQSCEFWQGYNYLSLNQQLTPLQVTELQNNIEVPAVVNS